MMDKPPQEPARSSRKVDLIELRIANLQRELEADFDPSARAAILYHMGSLYEHDLARTEQAMRCYARAREEAPSFEPALIARMRIAERANGSHDLATPCEETVAFAHSPAISAAALIDLALRSDEWASLLAEAIAMSPAPVVPALVLEWLSEAAGDRDSLGKALRAQALHASDPALRGALWIDVALNELENEDVDAALNALDLAAESGAVAWSARSLQRRICKQHQRWNVSIRVAESMASLLEDAARAGRTVDPLRMPVPEHDRLSLAVLLWQEAAACSANQLSDTITASRHLDAALPLRPQDVQLRLQSLSFAERLGDDDAADRASAWFLDVAPDHPAFVAYQIRRALASAEQSEALDVLRNAATRRPASRFAQAALDVGLMRSAAHAELADRIRERARGYEGEARQLASWHASLSRVEAPDQTELCAAAAEDRRWEVPILRDALGFALAAKEARAVVARCEDLLERRLDPEERALLAFSKYDVTQNALGENQEARRLLRDAVGEPTHRSWAPFLARVRGALDDDPALLASGHEALAGLTDGSARVGHLCAAGEAHARAGDWSASERVIRQALELAPGDRHVLALLDGVLRESGRTEDVVALAREYNLALAPTTEASRDLSLLLAGANAERAGNLPAARCAYEQALADTPGSPSAALALAEVARRESDAGARLRAYASLAEGSLGGGAPELCSLLRGDALAFGTGPACEASLAYEKALDHPVSALNGATALLSMPVHLTTDEQRSAAEEVLGDATSTTEPSGNGFGSAYGALRAAFGHPGAATGDAWLELAALAPTDGLRAGALLQGLRSMRVARGDEALDDLFILTQESEELAGERPEAAIAIDEALAPGDDPELRVASLERKRQHSADIGRGAIEAAHCRALVEAERGAEAVALLSSVLEQRPDDLAVWETLRTAARQAGQWPLVAQACERLAQFVSGPLEADLLEEAGIVRLDCMEQHQQAEDLFRSALDADPTRSVAFRRLYDLLAEKEDAEALEALVSERLEQGGSQERPDLLYERARLLRGFSDRPGALEVLGELFTTDPDHAGALALAAEVHVSLEQWEDAVDSLRRLARSNIPGEQRRLAHLAASEFLDAHLGAKDEALAELRAIEALGSVDAETWARIGALEESLGRPKAAMQAYDQTLQAEPAHEAAIAALVGLLEGAEKQAALIRYERALWAQIEQGNLEASSLRGLRNAAGWRGQFRRAAAIRAVERTLGLEPVDGDPCTFDPDGVAIDPPWQEDAFAALDQVLRRVGPSLSKLRLRAVKAAPDDPVRAELGRLSQTFGARAASVGICSDVSHPVAYGSPDGEIHWLVPSECRDGLDERARFHAGRLAWAVPRGAGWLLGDSTLAAAGKIAATLRAARCEVESDEPMLPAAEIKLRRSARRAVQEAVGGTVVDSSTLLRFAHDLLRAADRAGLLATGNVAAALHALFGESPTLAALKSSERGFDLIRFCIDDESTLWGRDA